MGDHEERVVTEMTQAYLRAYDVGAQVKRDERPALEENPVFEKNPTPTGGSLIDGMLVSGLPIPVGFRVRFPPVFVPTPGVGAAVGEKEDPL
jgi:hypothetical protein